MRLFSRRVDMWRRAGNTLALLVLSGPTHAQQVEDDASNDRPPRLRMSLTYQYSETNDLATDVVTIRSGPSYAQALDFGFDFALNERWTLIGGLPLIAKRFDSPSHDPLAIDPPHPE
jgi:hypothetical protein